MTTRCKYWLLHVLALAVSVIPPVTATLYQFPIWLEKGREESISALTVILLALCCIPFFRSIKEFFKSPSATTVWGLGLLFLWLFNNIADEMIVVFAVGFVSNSIGALLFRWRNKYREGRNNG